MDTRLPPWLSVFGPAAILALVFTAPAAIEHDWTQPVRLGRVTVGLLPARWLIVAVMFTLIAHGHPARQERRTADWFVMFGAAALVGVLAVVPFAVMEVYNNPRIRSGEFAFPYALFHGMWLFPTMLFLAATPLVRQVSAGDDLMAHPIALLLRSAFLVVVAAGWLFVLQDQMPCFLGGVPGCD